MLHHQPWHRGVGDRHPQHEKAPLRALLEPTAALKQLASKRVTRLTSAHRCCCWKSRKSPPWQAVWRCTATRESTSSSGRAASGWKRVAYEKDALSQRGVLLVLTSPQGEGTFTLPWRGWGEGFPPHRDNRKMKTMQTSTIRVQVQQHDDRTATRTPGLKGFRDERNGGNLTLRPDETRDIDALHRRFPPAAAL